MGNDRDDPNKLANVADKAIRWAENNPESANRLIDVASQLAPSQTKQGGAQNHYPNQNSPYPPQAEEPQAKKPLRRGISTQSMIMMGVGALMLMLALGPIIFPAMAGMGVVGSTVMAVAGMGIFAYGLTKVIEDRDPPSTGNSNRIQPMPSQMVNEGHTPDSQMVKKGHTPNSQTNLQNVFEQVQSSGVLDGVKPKEAISKEVDEFRVKLMDKLALPENLREMLKSDTTEMESFKKGFDSHLRESFFANMGEKQTGKGDAGMGKEFLTKVNEDGSQENKAFNDFKDNMLALLRKDQEHYQSSTPQAHDELIAEKSALTTAINQIDGLRAGNKVSKESLDNSGFINVSPEKKQEANNQRLQNLTQANTKISDANKKLFTSKTTKTTTTSREVTSGGRGSWGI
ncbi:hypothetical protein LBMAG18_06720 [Alphaproteobacteria bacterium]|nr:hypothetical protein LBMAG18_06720 [Alphaproteobacteria bacterium]